MNSDIQLKPEKQQKTGLYNIFWRWHFYAALLITPLLLTLTISGIGYLFYNEVENKAYHDVFFGKSEQTEPLTIDEGIEKAVAQNKGFSVSKVIILADPYNTRLTLTNENGDEKYVFLDDHHQIVGSQNAKYTFSNLMREIHSSLFVGGTIVNYLVELAACWAIFMLLTGVYMTFKGRALKKIPNLTKRQKTKRWHALVGTIITIPLIIVIFTGLPWSAVMGDLIYTSAQKYPAYGTPILKQQPPTSDMSEIPWATRKNNPPTSNQSHQHHGELSTDSSMPNSSRISVEQLITKVEKTHITKPYSIIYPEKAEGVYTVSKGSNTGITGLDVSPYEEITAYFDQYMGNQISKVSYQDYGILAKWFTWGIPLHEGHLFGWPNKLMNLAVCLSFLFVIFWGIKTWLSRKKEGEFSAPPKVSGKLSIGFLIFMVFLGFVMPLFGLSLIMVVLFEGISYLIKKVKNQKI